MKGLHVSTFREIPDNKFYIYTIESSRSVDMDLRTRRTFFTSPMLRYGQVSDSLLTLVSWELA